MFHTPSNALQVELQVLTRLPDVFSSKKKLQKISDPSGEISGDFDPDKNDTL